ncbi:maltodextrin ABC transporter substrate-binding protein MdxE [Brochothrix campestris FSL F6-1037]|uniref:Maltodextrin ABC transporter substrate-binding protein MdxE n=1 Tax=Brochothrix campestris FSL F6-1037 TaxID=1265861 RepID=W7CYJ4_9LIST|nr:maltodextrin ABC transporter substrate-binding protein MdxE [Brochothrix campestris FSL F6-1037]
MKKKLTVFASLLLIFTLVLAGCSSSSSKKEEKKSSDSDSNTLTVSVEETYKPYVESIKAQFEKDNDAKIKIVTKPMFDQLEAIPLDGPAGKAPDVTMAAYDRVGGLAQQGHLAEVTELAAADFSDKEKKSCHIREKTIRRTLCY